MDKKVKILDRALRALFPKTYKGLRNRIIEKYEYDMAVRDGYEEYDDHYYWSLLKEEEQEHEIDEDDAYYRALCEKEEQEERDIDPEEYAQIMDEIHRREEETRKAHVEQLCADDPSLMEIFKSYSSIEEACDAVEREVQRRKAERTKFLDDVIGKISTEGLEAAMDFYKTNKTSP